MSDIESSEGRVTLRKMARPDDSVLPAHAEYLAIDQDGKECGHLILLPDHEGEIEVRYMISERSRGEGVATAAIRKLVANSGHQFRASVLKSNVASQKVLSKAGFTILRTDPSPDGAIHFEYKRTIA